MRIWVEASGEGLWPAKPIVAPSVAGQLRALRMVEGKGLLPSVPIGGRRLAAEQPSSRTLRGGAGGEKGGAGGSGGAGGAVGGGEGVRNAVLRPLMRTSTRSPAWAARSDNLRQAAWTRVRSKFATNESGCSETQPAAGCWSCSSAVTCGFQPLAPSHDPRAG
eukprot:scaffold17877_cov66-Phaeocystis_antarctica.AAC.2